MKIHSDTLTKQDLTSALRDAGLHDVHAEAARVGSRSRSNAFQVRLEAEPKKGRRPRNSGTYGAENSGQLMTIAAATYDEHGAWMARLYELDPYAIVGPYKSRSDFHRATRDAYKLTTTNR